MPTATQTPLVIAYEALTTVRAFNEKRRSPDFNEINARWRVFVGIVFEELRETPEITELVVRLFTLGQSLRTVKEQVHAESLALRHKHDREALPICNGLHALSVLRGEEERATQIGPRLEEWASIRVKKEAEAACSPQRATLEGEIEKLKTDRDAAIRSHLSQQGVEEEDIQRILHAFTKGEIHD